MGRTMGLTLDLGDNLVEIPILALLIPFLLLWVFTFVFGYFIGRRKGIGVLGALVGMFPFWAVAVLFWWLSVTDKDVLERLSRLESSSNPLYSP
jgi:hypothetical protein